MSVRKRPVATVAPSSRRRATTASTSGSACSGRAAASHDGRRPFVGVAVERELRDHQQRRADVGRRHVHHAVGVVEDPQVPELVGQLGGGAGVVVVGHADEHAQPGADGADDLVAHRHRRSAHPLHDRPHGRRTYAADPPDRTRSVTGQAATARNRAGQRCVGSVHRPWARST